MTCVSAESCNTVEFRTGQIMGGWMDGTFSLLHQDVSLNYTQNILSILDTCKEIKYLERYISDDLSDDRDICRQHHMLYAQANMLISQIWNVHTLSEDCIV